MPCYPPLFEQFSYPWSTSSSTQSKDMSDSIKWVRVACISDTHTSHDKIPGGIPPCDLLVHAGDLTYTGKYEKIMEFDDFGSHIPLPETKKIFTPGNHDILFQTEVEKATAFIFNWTCLIDEATEVCGLKVYGAPWSPNFFPDRWAFNQGEEEAEERWKAIPDDTDILVVHGPPRGYGDTVTENGKRIRVGCRPLARRLERVRPKLVVCGHLHEGYGTYATSWGGVLVNASILNDHYKPIREAIVVNVPVLLPSS